MRGREEEGEDKMSEIREKKKFRQQNNENLNETKRITEHVEKT